jgi:hypothetical protein
MINNTVFTITVQNEWLSFELLFVNKELTDLIPKTFYLNKGNYKLLYKLKNIKNLIFDNEFNEEIVIPKGIEAINLGYKFQKKIELPNSMKYISFHHFKDFEFSRENSQKNSHILFISPNIKVVNVYKNKNRRFITPSDLKNEIILKKYHKIKKNNQRTDLYLGFEYEDGDDDTEEFYDSEDGRICF